MSDAKTIFRTVKRENPYVQIDKTVLNDERLSWKAKGLMAFLLSKPDNWVINVNNLIKQARDGKEAVYSAINELIKFGYVVRLINRKKGQFAQIEYLIFENPQINNSLHVIFPAVKIQQNLSITPLPGNPDAVKPDVGNPDMIKPELGNSYTGKPDTENPPILINDFINNDFNKTPPLYSPQQPFGEGEGNHDLKILEPIAFKLFGQANNEILKNLFANIKEFRLDPEVVKESLNHIDAKDIKSNPYGYFRFKYAIAVGIITKRMQNLEQQIQMEEYIKQQDTLGADTDMENKSTLEIIADIKKKLGITPEISIKE